MMSAPRPVKHPTGRGGQAIALAGGDEISYGLAVTGKAGGKDLPIPRGHHEAAAIGAVNDLRWRGGKLMISRQRYLSL